MSQNQPTALRYTPSIGTYVCGVCTTFMYYNGIYLHRMHISQNSFNKWTQILSLETTIFELKMMVETEKWS